MISAQNALRDVFVARSFDLEKVKTASAKNIGKILEDLMREIERELRNADPTGVTRTAYQQERLNKLFNMADKTIKSQYKGIYGIMTSELATLAEIEGVFAANAINAVLKVDVLDYVVSREVLEKLATDTLIEGAPSAEWWSKQAVSLQDEFKRVMRVGVAKGETLQQMSARVMGTQKPSLLGVRGRIPGVTDEVIEGLTYEPGLLKKARRNAQALVRTSYQTVMSEARQDAYRANDDVIKGIQQISTIDSRVTIICRAYDGATWDLNRQPILGNKLPYNNGVPRHWGAVLQGTLITTPFGQTPIEQIQVGDLVLTHKGRFMPVYAVMQKTNDVSVMRIIKLSSDSSVCLTDCHPILVSRSGALEWLRADELQIGDKLFENMYESAPSGSKSTPINSTHGCPPLFCKEDVTFDVLAGEVATSSVDLNNNLVVGESKIANIRGYDKLPLGDNVCTVKQAEKNLFSDWGIFKLPLLNVFAATFNRLRERIGVVLSHSLGSPSVKRMCRFVEAKSPVFFSAKHSFRSKLLHNLARCLVSSSRYNPMSNAPLLQNGFTKLHLALNLSQRLSGLKMFFVDNFLNNRFIGKVRPAICGFVNSNIKILENAQKPRVSNVKLFCNFLYGLFSKKIFFFNKTQDLAPVCKINRNAHNWLLSEVTNISIVAQSKDLCNLAVEKDESYLANDIIVHNCRSVEVPVLKELEEILGVPGMSAMPTSTRSSIDGQISTDVTFDEWMKARPVSEQVKVLGKGRQQLWADGKLTLADMLNPQTGQVMSLKALREKTEKGLFYVPTN